MPPKNRTDMIQSPETERLMSGRSENSGHFFLGGKLIPNQCIRDVP